MTKPKPTPTRLDLTRLDLTAAELAATMHAITAQTAGEMDGLDDAEIAALESAEEKVAAALAQAEARRPQ
jgi:uncharacterized ferredoxin-like protein